MTAENQETLQDNDAQYLNEFKTLTCSYLDIPPEDFEKKMLAKILFKRARLVKALFRLIGLELFYQERVLIRHAARCHSISEIRNEIDFYQHKYVVNKFWKDIMHFRASGQALIRLANKIFPEQ